MDFETALLVAKMLDPNSMEASFTMASIRPVVAPVHVVTVTTAAARRTINAKIAIEAQAPRPNETTICARPLILEQEQTGKRCSGAHSTPEIALILVV